MSEEVLCDTKQAQIVSLDNEKGFRYQLILKLKGTGGMAYYKTLFNIVRLVNNHVEFWAVTPDGSVTYRVGTLDQDFLDVDVYETLVRLEERTKSNELHGDWRENIC